MWVVPLKRGCGEDSMGTDFVIVSTTIDSTENAGRLGRAIVEMRLAACVHMMPVASIYRWQGEIKTAEEYRILAKTRADLADSLVEFIKENHPYEVPEIIVTPILTGHETYLHWLTDETGQNPATD